MAIIETEGLILKSYDLSDADKIVIFMTKNEGLIRGVAKGAKRLKSKFGGSLEPFTIVNLTYFQKEERELVSIRNVELEKSYFKHTSHIMFLQKFVYMAELLIDFSPPHDPNERLYKMSKACLDTASYHTEHLETIALYFELWILRLGGFLPIWSKCKSCKNFFSENEISNLQYDFQLLCNNCQNVKKNRSISSIQRNLFVNAQKVSPNKFIEITLNHEEDVRQVSTILKRLITQVLGKELRTQKILTAN